LLAAVALALSLPPAQGVEGQDVNQAVDRGVQGLKALQRADGNWPAQGSNAEATIPGATALAGLTLLECNLSADDPAVAKAAQAVRAAAPVCCYTYAVALSILFLDRLGDPADVPLIGALACRLLAGQGDGGGWSYQCPQVVTFQEVKALMRRQAEFIARRQLPKPGEAASRGVHDLPALLQDYVKRIVNGPANSVPQGGDNSNTQFAALALWAARRYGIPVDVAMGRLERRFRHTQLSDGGWGYQPSGAGALAGSTPTMTCAGILALEISCGLTGNDKKPRDPVKDQQLADGLQLLARHISGPKPNAAKKDGKFYYFVWSVERVCVIIDRQKLGDTDWYKWGSAILVANQGADGLWQGDYAESGADTCFALLFLRRANLARDLSARFRGEVSDRPVRAGGGKDVEKRPGGEPAKEKAKPQEAKALPELGDTPKERLAKELIGASADHRPGLLHKFTAGRGPEYTDALALAASYLEGDAQAKTREALTTRMARMQPRTLVEYLPDEDAEIRRAAARACGLKRLRSSIPALVKLLRDPQESVIKAAHESLKTLAGADLGTNPEPWEEWLKKSGK
jgi:hypothetical protein